MNIVNDIQIELNIKKIEDDLKQYVQTYIYQQCIASSKHKLENNARHVNDKIGRVVAQHMNKTNLEIIVEDVFKQTDIEPIIKQCIERQIGKKVSKLLEDMWGYYERSIR